MFIKSRNYNFIDEVLIILWLQSYKRNKRPLYAAWLSLFQLTHFAP